MTTAGAKVWLGIDIGGTSIKGALLDGGREVWTGRSGEYARPGRAELVGALAGLIAASPVGSGDGRVGRVGVCAPGVRDGAGVIVRAVNVPGLEGAAVDELVAEGGRGKWEGGSGSVVREFTDAHAAAVDFWRARPGAGRLLALSMGTGIGACVLDACAGREPAALIVSGGGPGHIGQMDVWEFEGEVSTGKKASRHPPKASRHEGGTTLEAYMGLPALRARFGDELAGVMAAGEMRVDRPPLGALVRALRIAHAIYAPERVALLGGVGIRMGPLVEVIRGAVSDGLTTLARPGWTLEVGESDFHAARGAAWLAGKAMG